MAATDDLDAVAAREDDLRLLGYGFHVAGMPGRLLYRCGPANARTHHLHIVQASTLPAPDQVLLRDNGDDYTRAKTELIQELTDKARAERGLPPTRCGRSEQCGKSERCGRQRPLRQVRLPR